MATFNATTHAFDLPPLPEYTLSIRPALFPPIADNIMALLLPLLAYWGLSMFFHLLDTLDLFPQYRLHTPAEVAKRNRASRYEVVKDVLIQQFVQTAMGYLVTLTEPDEYIGKSEYDIAVWAQRIRLAQRAIPSLLSFIGLNAKGIASNLSLNHPTLAGALTGGQYPSLTTLVSNSSGAPITVPTFAKWELLTAHAIYYYLVPALQFGIAIIIVDTWQYWLHRLMHTSRWLYTTFHSRHHRLYVPYAYGALYNHPFEGFLLDTVGALLAFSVTGMTARQGMCFFTGSTLKTVDDHCGYALPFDPLQMLTGNNAGYHDVHHQSWGIKTNFSQPFFTFWDRALGTKWVGGDVSARYEKSRVAAQKAVDLDTIGQKTGITHSSADKTDVSNPGKVYENDTASARVAAVPETYKDPQPPLGGRAEAQAAGSRQSVLEDKAGGGIQTLMAEATEERAAREEVEKKSMRQRRKSSGKETLAGLRERVSGAGAHGRGVGVLGMESGA